LPAPALAASDALLSKLAGDWVGRGTYRQSADAQPERIFCKVSNQLVDGGGALQQRGRCSLASGSGPIDGIISADGGGRNSGSLSSLASDGPAQLSGSGSGNRLVLDTSFIDARTNQPAKSTTTMTLSGGSYRLLSERKDGGKNWTASDITFAPQ
jgi:hypothetical protein